MRIVTVTEAKRGFAALIEAAAKEPVIIRRRQRDVAVLISPLEYERLICRNVAEFQRFCNEVGERAAASGLTEQKLKEVLRND